MKRRAAGLLVLATGVFVVARALEARHGQFAYVRAAAEAAMVGGLADWFAVTALFRHPLRIPIPHTAIIPTRKNDIGRGLGAFVQQNFLDPDAILDKVRSLRPAERLGIWMTSPTNAQTVARFVSGAVRTAMQIIDDDQVQPIVERAVRTRIDRTPVAPIAGRVLAVATNHGRHHDMVEGAIGALASALHENRAVLRERFATEAPKWLPGRVEDRVFQRLYDGIQGFLLDVRLNRDHEMRRQLDTKIVELADRLQHDSELIERGEQLKRELLDHPAFRAWSSSLWAELKALIVDQASTPTSALQLRLADAVRALGVRAGEDRDLRVRLDTMLEGVIRTVVASQGHEFANVIAQTVERWDATEAATRIERQVGRDLQFIRINGTLVGGLAGLVIFSVSRLWG